MGSRGGSVFGKYLRREMKAHNLSLDHDEVTDFYVSCLQRNRATLPLLCVRAILFLGCVAILITSMILTEVPHIGYWFINMTHWGLILIILATGFALAVSFRAYLRGPIDCKCGLPWYVKTYWALYDITISIAIFITAFYWAFLGREEELAIDLILDIFIHAVNSAVMLVMMFTSRLPAHILHFYMPVAFGIVYLLFSLFYYLAGGVNQYGDPYIYPPLDWTTPGQTMIVVALSALMILVLHLIVVALTALRDFLTRSFQKDSKAASAEVAADTS